MKHFRGSEVNVQVCMDMGLRVPPPDIAWVALDDSLYQFFLAMPVALKILNTRCWLKIWQIITTMGIESRLGLRLVHNICYLINSSRNSVSVHDKAMDNCGH